MERSVVLFVDPERSVRPELVRQRAAFLQDLIERADFHCEVSNGRYLDNTKIPAGSVAVVVSWEAYGRSSKPSHPVIIDLPYRAFAEAEQIGRQMSIEQKLLALSHADCITTSESSIRLYATGWLLQAGRVSPKRDFVQCVTKDESRSFICFLENPESAVLSEPIYGSVTARPAFLQPPRQDGILSGSRIEQSFVVPAENISAVSVGIVGAPEGLQWTVRRRYGGQILARGSADRSQLPDTGNLVIKFPVFRSPRGGEELTLSLVDGLPGRVAHPGRGRVEVAACQTRRFPCISPAATDGTKSDRLSVDATLALGFIPGESSMVYRVRILTQRAVQLVKQGEYRRFVRALRRRIPELVKYSNR